jgi:hypothetical protein
MSRLGVLPSAANRCSPINNGYGLIVWDVIFQYNWTMLKRVYLETLAKNVHRCYYVTSVQLQELFLKRSSMHV